MRIIWCLFLFTVAGCECAVIDPFARPTCGVCDAGADVSVDDASTRVSDAGGFDAGLDAGVRDGGGSRLFVAAAEQYPMVWHHAATPGAVPDMRLPPIAAVGFAAIADRLVVVGSGRIGSFDGIDLVAFDGGATQSLALPPGPGPSPQVLIDRSLTVAGGAMWFLAVGTINAVLDPLTALTAQQMPMGPPLVFDARSAAYQPSSDRLYTSGPSGVLIWSSASALVGATNAQPLFKRSAERTVIAAGRLFVTEGGINNLLIWEGIAQAGTNGHPITAFEADTVITLPSPIVDVSVKARGAREALLIALASGAVLIFEDASAVHGLTDVTRTITDPSIDVPTRVIMGADETLYVGDSNGVTVIGNSISAPRFIAELLTNSRVIDLQVTAVAPPP